MRLRIVTPLNALIDEEGVTALRAEDASGSFGILAGHAPFLTTLATTVVRWTGANGVRHYCAVRNGVLSMTDGNTIAIATREAIVGDDLAELDRQVISRFEADLEAERVERFEGTRLQLDAIRKIVAHLQSPGSGSGGPFA
ncbi:MAG: F0F1 ATP synthase subunit epsilon [Ancalomicrobiaceae bacterium]|nr:F0F1 ATP synthase subunit epsilon [Ancalomicrobiaceae bacterium]